MGAAFLLSASPGLHMDNDGRFLCSSNPCACIQASSGGRCMHGLREVPADPSEWRLRGNLFALITPSCIASLPILLATCKALAPRVSLIKEHAVSLKTFIHSTEHTIFAGHTQEDNSMVAAHQAVLHEHATGLAGQHMQAPMLRTGYCAWSRLPCRPGPVRAPHLCCCHLATANCDQASFPVAAWRQHASACQIGCC